MWKLPHSKMRRWLKRFDYYLTKVLPREPAQYKFKFKFKFCKDDPEHVHDKVVYIVGEHPHLWKMCFKCPCGCNEIIDLNLLEQATPCWKFTIRWHKISIYPSVWRRVGCRSHFHIRRGNVEWSQFIDGTS